MEDAEPEARQPAAQDAPQPRKPGCFLRGSRLASVVCGGAYAGGIATLAVFAATPLGMVVAAGICLWSLASGLGSALWPQSRLHTVLTAALVCLAAAFFPLLYAVDLLHVAAGCALGGLFGFLAYIGFKRKRRRRWQFEPLPVRVALGLTGIGLVVGVAVGLFFCLDENPKAFPGLEVRPPAADEENGFVVLSGAMEAMPEPVWDDLSPFLREPPDGLPRGSREWREKALDVLVRYKGCLAAVDEVLAKPRFVTPLPRTFAESQWVSSSEWSGYCRRMKDLLLTKSRLLLLEGDVPGAMDAADKVVRLGRLIVRDSGNVSGFLAGVHMMEAGMPAVRDAAASPSATSQLVSSQQAVLDLAGDLRTGFARGLAGEMTEQRLFLDALASLEVFEDSHGRMAPPPAWSRVLLREPLRPGLKLNMTMNALGAAYERSVSGLDHYQPLVPDESFRTFWAFARRVGWRRATSNMVGEVLGTFTKYGTERVLPKYFHHLAEQRLTQAYLALRCYQLERRRLPEALDELAPAYIESVPLDTFTEAPFVYEPAGAPPRIFSVGPDQQPDPPDAEDKDDIVVELNFPAP